MRASWRAGRNGGGDHRGKLLCDSHREVGRDRGAAGQGWIAGGHRDGVGGFGLEIEGGAGLEEQLRADHLKAGGIVTGEGDRLAAQGVIADGDVRHLDSAGGGGVLHQKTDGIGEAQGCGGLVDKSIIGKHVGEGHHIGEQAGYGIAVAAVAGIPPGDDRAIDLEGRKGVVGGEDLGDIGAEQAS